MESEGGSVAANPDSRRPGSGGPGKARRLARLRAPEGFFLWLALDHGLTRGVLDGLGDVRASLRLTESADATGVVVNRGFASSLPVRARAGLVLQTFGLPATSGTRDSRVLTCRVEDALRLAADAIAVQLDLNAAGLPAALSSLAGAISDAATYDLPVLLMATPVESTSQYDAFADTLRICAELGADVIKIALPASANEATDAELSVLRDALKRAPPALLCGGERRPDFSERLTLACELGFRGVCVGRHVFQAEDPRSALGTIADVLRASGSRA